MSVSLPCKYIHPERTTARSGEVWIATSNTKITDYFAVHQRNSTKEYAKEYLKFLKRYNPSSIHRRPSRPLKRPVGKHGNKYTCENAKTDRMKDQEVAIAKPKDKLTYKSYSYTQKVRVHVLIQKQRPASVMISLGQQSTTGKTLIKLPK